MRREFSRWIENFGRNEPRLIFLTGDLGFGALENVQNALQERFVNMGVCEQNMISVAAGLSQKGLLPAALGELPAFRPIRKLAANRMPRPMATVVGLGPVLLNALSWILDEGKVDLFVVAQIPLTELSDELVASVHASGLLWVIEEHVARGGLAEHLVLAGSPISSLPHPRGGLPRRLIWEPILSPKPLWTRLRIPAIVVPTTLFLKPTDARPLYAPRRQSLFRHLD